jgi:dephospho-CoA kinase
MLIGVTGTIGAGKSLVAGELARQLDGLLFDADKQCRDLMEPGETGYRRIVERWGTRFLSGDGSLDRDALAHAVFSEKTLRSQLENILHPLVRSRLREILPQGDQGTFVVADIPLLFEAGWEHDCDLVVCVVTDEKTAVSRVRNRDGRTVQEVHNILASQMPAADKAAMSDYVIDNSGTFEQTSRQVAQLSGVIKRAVKP